MVDKYAFASYSHRDDHQVIKIVEELLNRGVQVWMDRFQIAPGEEVSRSISSALLDATVLLWFAGHGTHTSSWVEFELQAFQRNSNIIIIPILLEGADQAKLPTFLKK